MASYPGSKVHRVSRRKLGRGQTVQQPAVTAVVTGAVDTATITFSVPVVVQGPLNLAVQGDLVPVSQTVVSNTEVQILYSVPLTGLTYTLSSGNVSTFQGGMLAPTSGTF